MWRQLIKIQNNKGKCGGGSMFLLACNQFTAAASVHQYMFHSKTPPQLPFPVALSKWGYCVHQFSQVPHIPKMKQLSFFISVKQKSSNSHHRLHIISTSAILYIKNIQYTWYFTVEESWPKLTLSHAEKAILDFPALHCPGPNFGRHNPSDVSVKISATFTGLLIKSWSAISTNTS